MSTSILFEKLIQCALLIVLGFACGKLGLIDDAANRKLSGVLLNIVSPCIILTSYQLELSQEILQNMLITLSASAGSLLLLLLGTFVFVRRSQPEFRVERMCIIYGNCGFMGLALISEMFGAEGVLYNTAYITVSTILLWTHGVILMSGAADGKSVLKNLLTPSLLSIFAGLLMFLTRFRIPEILENTLEMVGGMNTPLAMMIAGVSIAGSDLRAAFSRFRFYYITFVHNLLMPALLVLLLAAIPVIPREVLMVVSILNATPVASACITFALRYHRNDTLAAEIFALSTAVSVVSIPMIYLLAETLR